MILIAEKPVRFINVENRVSKKTDKPFQLVIVADMDKIEKYDFFKRDDLDLNGIANNTDVLITLETSKHGYNTNIDLVKVVPVK